MLGGEEGHSRISAGNGFVRQLKADLPYDIFQIDEHRLDVIGTVRIDTPKGPQLIPMSRMALVLVANVFPPCIVGYHVAIRREASADDVIQALRNSLEIWKPRE